MRKIIYLARGKNVFSDFYFLYFNEDDLQKAKSDIMLAVVMVHPISFNPIPFRGFSGLFNVPDELITMR